MKRADAKQKMYQHLKSDWDLTWGEAKDSFEMEIIDEIYDHFEALQAENEKLKAPKTCDGCANYKYKWELVCQDCIRYRHYSDLYEPKDNQ